MNDDLKIAKLGACNIVSPLKTSDFVSDDQAVLVDATTRHCDECKRQPPCLEMAGPRKNIYFNPDCVRAAIVTCGGLCPGLNDVIRGLTMVLWHRYGVREIFGQRYGYEGLVEKFGHKPLALNPEAVADIHKDGGTILGSSRGKQDMKEMAGYLVANRINMLFAIGGDGTQQGALALGRELNSSGHSISVVGIPKTIDNDIAYTDRTFGFETAVALSQNAISSAHMEARGYRNGVGLVKLMGRDSGFVAAYASLASSDVNAVLIPEVKFKMEVLLEALRIRLERKSHAVIVVAEGAGQDLLPSEGVDKSGNIIHGDIGLYLKKSITDYCKAGNIPVGVRYIDPSYTIRSARATPDDSVLCFRLAEYAVHAAMSGRTGMIVSRWNNHYVHVPMSSIAGIRKKIDPSGLLWHSVLSSTGQPSFVG